MKKILTIVLLSLSLIVITGCSNLNLVSDTQSNNVILNEERNDNTTDDQKTGNLISGIYSFDKHTDVENFYNVYMEKNPVRFIIPNFDDDKNVKYIFECSGIDSKIISEKIYDYDFPNPKFNIETKDYTIYLKDVSIFSDTLNLINEINGNIIASLAYDFELSADEIIMISNKFVERLKYFC